MLPPDFINFWKQCYQQGLNPVACTIGKALLFPSALEAVGDIGYNLTTECWWTPSHPFKSSLTGQTYQEIGDAFTADTGKQWTQPLLHYAVFEVVADALKRATNVDDKQVILDAIKATNLDTMCGNVNWQAGPPQNPRGRAEREQDAARRRPVGQGRDVPVRPQDRHQRHGARDHRPAGRRAHQVLSARARPDAQQLSDRPGSVSMTQRGEHSMTVVLETAGLMQVVRRR